MNRDITAAAAVLGIGPHRLRRKLRDMGVLTKSGELACAYRDQGRFLVETRQRWNAHISQHVHYGVVLVTEPGIQWLAEVLGKPVRQMPPRGAAGASEVPA